MIQMERECQIADLWGLVRAACLIAEDLERPEAAHALIVVLNAAAELAELTACGPPSPKP